MLDLGRSLIAAVERDPGARAIVDGDLSLTFAAWFERISGIAAGLDTLGLKRGDRVLTLLQNNWQAASLHWACQLLGLIITPVNWRASAEDADFCLRDSGARAVIHQADNPVAASVMAPIHFAIESPVFTQWCEAKGPDAAPRADADDWSLMLYTSGTTARPKGVPRRHRAERAAAIAHVAQNLYRYGESTLGVMPLYHTMGVRSLLAMSLIGGCFVCLPRFSPPSALELIERERISALYLVPTLYHDLIHHPDFTAYKSSSVRKLGFAGASITDGLLKKLDAAFKPDLFVNHYGSSEVYTCTINPDAVSKPGSAGKSGINQMIRVVRFGAKDVEARANPYEEGEIIALLAGDEAFEGYWQRPEANAASLRQGWFFTGDTGYFDEGGDLYVTGRVDDMIITGGENVSPLEVESCLSLHPAVAEVAVVGLPDERWGKIVTAFIKGNGPIDAAMLDQFCRQSDLANFKRPRRFVFIDEIPKSPVGKLLRRKLLEISEKLPASKELF